MTVRSCCSVLVLAMVLSGCAARVAAPAPEVPAAAAFPDFVYPAIPAALQSSDAAVRTERGWRYLQGANPDRAQEEFDAALRRNPGFFPALTGRGYVALARGRHRIALEAFQGALDRERRYAPALVGRGQALLSLNREDEALQAFESALSADPSLTQLRSRVEVLRFRRVQSAIERARDAASSGDTALARREYAAAIEASPDSAFLHRELAAVERTAGDTEAALQRFSRAVELDPLDAESLVAIGELLEARGDTEGARAAYARALEVNPAPETSARLAALEERARDADLPPALRGIREVPAITRAQLAALIAARFATVLSAAPAQQIVMTDTRGHWAESSMQAVAAAGVLDLYENHAFQPESAVRRVDLADAAHRLALLADPQRPELEIPPDRRPAIADINAGHLNYPAVSFAVAAQVMPLLEQGRFEVARPVSGAEAADVLARLRELVANAR